MSSNAATAAMTADPSVDLSGVSLADLADELAGRVERFDPKVVSVRDAKAAAEVFGRIERLGGAGKTLAVGRVAESSAVWGEKGDRSAAAWLARTQGTSVTEAQAVLATARHLESLPQTEAALREGRLSGRQVEVIAAAAVVDPAGESQLLSKVPVESYRDLRDASAAFRVSRRRDDDAARYAAMRAKRCFKRWTGHRRDGRRAAAPHPRGDRRVRNQHGPVPPGPRRGRPGCGRTRTAGGLPRRRRGGHVPRRPPHLPHPRRGRQRCGPRVRPAHLRHCHDLVSHKGWDFAVGTPELVPPTDPRHPTTRAD